MPYTDTTPMPMGKEHKGKALANVPASYLIWIYQNLNLKNYPDLIDYIKDNWDVLQAESKKYLSK